MPIKKGERISPQTEFKLGIIPKNKLPVGTITIRKHKGDSKRLWIKIAEPNKWIQNADFVWLKNHNSIPSDYVVHHLDHNTLNDDLSNLALMSRKDHIAHHRSDLLEGKVGLVIKTKEIYCSICGENFTGKYQLKNRYCENCKKIKHRQYTKEHKKVLRMLKRIAKL